MSKRLDWIDMERGIAMICVYIWHIGLYREDANFPWYIFFEYFLIPVFFFISGYLFKETIDNKRDLKRLYKRLIIPYFFLGFLVGIKPSLIQTKGVYAALCNSLWNVLTGHELWFIACLIVVEFCAIVLKNLINENNRTIYKFVLIEGSICCYFLLFREGVISPNYWMWCNAILGLGYFAGGSLYRKYETRLSFGTNMNNIILTILAISYISMTFVAHFLLGCHIDFASLEISNAPLVFILTWVSIIVLTSLCKVMTANHYLLRVGRSSLFLFAINIWIIKLLVPLDRILHIIPTYLIGIIITILAISISLQLNSIVRKFAPWAIGE